jgi:hypothetical protein
MQRKDSWIESQYSCLSDLGQDEPSLKEYTFSTIGLPSESIKIFPAFLVTIINMRKQGFSANPF